MNTSRSTINQQQGQNKADEKNKKTEVRKKLAGKVHLHVSKHQIHGELSSVRALPRWYCFIEDSVSTYLSVGFPEYMNFATHVVETKVRDEDESKVIGAF